MDEFKKNMEVKVISDKGIWKGKVGKIISINDENDIEVRLPIKTEEEEQKYIIQSFSQDDIEEIQNESLILTEEKQNIKYSEDIINFLEFYDVMSKVEFTSILSEIGVENFDLSYAGISSKAKLGLIAKTDYIESLWEAEISELIVTEDDKVYSIPAQDFYNEPLQLELQTIDDIKNFIDIELDTTNESLEQNSEVDFIHDYVYSEEDEINTPSWFFVDKIASAENISSTEVINKALEYKYKIFVIDAPGFSKFIIGAKECKAEDIYNDYADYVPGNAEVKEIK